MKTLLTLAALAIAFALPAASPYTLEAPPGQHTNTIKSTPRIMVATNNLSGSVSHGGTVTLEINPANALGRFYADSLFSISTPDFSHGEEFGYGIGAGYAFTKTLSADLRVTHAGLNFENNAVSTVGGRVVSRLPFTFLSPYGYVGAQFDLGPDQWRLQPGIGLELGITKLMRGMSVFAEGGPNVDLTGHNTWLFGAGLRWRF